MRGQGWREQPPGWHGICQAAAIFGHGRRRHDERSATGTGGRRSQVPGGRCQTPRPVRPP